MSQLLGLLDLHDDIIAAIDVPHEEAPKVSEKELPADQRSRPGRFAQVPSRALTRLATR